MAGLFEHKRHLLRMAGLFAAGTLLFLVLQLLLVPKSFGVYGHYRAAALGEVAAQKPVFAGRAACAECHSDQSEQLATGAHKRLGCEACHGALASHAEKPEEAAAAKPDGNTICLTCHLPNVAKPAAFKQVDPKQHGEGNPCGACHAPHKPEEMP